MRKIALINQFQDLDISLSVFAKLAQEGKRVLIVDLRANKTKELTDESTNSFQFLNELDKPEKYIKTLEPNLDIIEGHRYINFQEFNLFYDLFKLQYFENKFDHLNYDYLVFENSSELSLLTLNSLFYVDEMMLVLDCDELGHDFACKAARFGYNFNKLYWKNIFFSKIIPVFREKANVEIYNFLLSEFTSNLISHPIVLKSKVLRESLSRASFSIIADEKKFDSTVTEDKKQRSINEYLNIMSETANVEVPLTKFLNEKKS